MAPRHIRSDQLADLLPASGLVWLQGCSTESALIRDGLLAAGERLSGLTLTGIFLPGLNRVDYAAAGSRRVRTYFMTPELKRAGERVEFLPFCYRDVLAHLRASTIDAALFSVSPPDENGLCSFGPSVDFLADLWRHIPLRIAHINPRLPRTHGPTAIPYAELSAAIEGEQDLPTSNAGSDAAAERIGETVAALIPDGATVQAGLGRTPEAAVSALRHHRRLAIHSGLIGDSTLRLLEAGALRSGHPVTVGLAVGTRALYDAVSAPEFQFHPVSHTHATNVLAGIPQLVTINSAIEVDLFGQAYAELTPKGFASGPGGAFDFAAGARAGNGLRILVLPATADRGAISRLVGPGGGSGLVSIGRFDTDIVVTEFGAADLRHKSHDRRAEALIGIAAPDHRAALAESWDQWRRKHAP